MEKEFASIEELDAMLDEEFKDAFEEVEEDEEETNEEETTQDEENGEDGDAADEEQNSDDDEEEDASEQEDETETPGGDQDDPAHFKFKKMREELRDLKQNVEQDAAYKAKMEGLAKSLGYNSTEELIAAQETLALTKEAEETGVPLEALRKQKGLEAKVTELETQKTQREAQEKQEKMNLGLKTFDDALVKALKANEIGLDVKEEILREMGADGYSLEDIAFSKAPQKIIKGYLADRIAAKDEQARLEAEKAAQEAAEAKLNGETDFDEDEEMKELKKELAAYARSEGITL